jgi:hypothetical protein
MTSILGQSLDYNKTSNQGNAYYNDLKLGTTTSEDVKIITNNQTRLTIDDDTGAVVIEGDLTINGTTSIQGDIDATNLPNLETIGSLNNTITAKGGLTIDQTMYATQLDGGALDISGNTILGGSLDVKDITSLESVGATNTTVDFIGSVNVVQTLASDDAQFNSLTVANNTSTNDITLTGANPKLTIPDNQISALEIKDSNGGFINFDSQNGLIDIERDTAIDANFEVSSNGTATFNNVAVSNDAWSHVATLDQQLDTTASPSFEGISVNLIDQKHISFSCNTERIELQLNRVNRIVSGSLNANPTYLDLPLPDGDKLVQRTYLHLANTNDITFYITATAGRYAQIFNDGSVRVLDDTNPYICKGHTGISFMITTYSTTSLPNGVGITCLNEYKELDLARLKFNEISGANEIIVPDTLADALSIKDSTNDYMVFNTTDEKIEIKQDLDVPQITLPTQYNWNTSYTTNTTYDDYDTRIIRATATTRMWAVTTQSFASIDTAIIKYTIESGNDSNELLIGVIGTGQVYGDVADGTLDNFVVFKNLNGAVIDKGNGGNTSGSGYTYTSDTDIKIVWSNNTIELWTEGILRVSYSVVNAIASNYHFVVADNTTTSSAFTIKINDTATINMKTSTAGLRIRDSSNDYMVFNTTDEKIEVKQDLEVTGDVNGATISDTQWGYLGAMDQSVATTDDVTFNKITSETFEQTKLTLGVSSSTPRFTLQPNRLHIIPNAGSQPSIGYLELDASILESGDRIDIISQYAGDLRVVKKDGGDNLTEILANGSNIAWNDDNTYFQLPRFTCARIIIHNSQRFNIKTCSRFGEANVSNTQWGYLGAMDQPVATTDSPTFSGMSLSGNLTYTGATGENTLIVPDNQADALSIKDTANDFIVFDSTISDVNIDIKAPVFLSDRVFYNTRRLTVSTSYVYLSGDYYLLCDPTSGAITYNLPNTTSLSGDIQLVIKNITTSTNTITITAGGSDTIDGASSVTLNTAYQSYTLISDSLNTAWFIV